MQPNLPIWTQRLPADVRRRLELTVAAAIEARSDAHAQQALGLVAILAGRVPFDAAVERYIDVMGLAAGEAESVRNRALAALGDSDLLTDLMHAPERGGWRLDWRYATPLGAMRFVRRQLRRSAEEDLWMELTAARAEEAVMRVHIRHALAFVQILGHLAPPTRAVTLYLDELSVPSVRARHVYQRVLARVADQELPRPDGSRREPPLLLPGQSLRSQHEQG